MVLAVAIKSTPGADDVLVRHTELSMLDPVFTSEGVVQDGCREPAIRSWPDGVVAVGAAMRAGLDLRNRLTIIPHIGLTADLKPLEALTRPF